MELANLEFILIISTVLELNPIFQTVRIIRTKSADDVSVWTFLSIIVVGCLWLYYGLLIMSWPLIVSNFIKLSASGSVVLAYFRYKKVRT